MSAVTAEAPAVTQQVAAEHGLTADEYARILRIMGRTPNLTELGIFSVMWSEHCSYKSSRKWLKRLPTEGPQVIQGPGENAGVVDIGDGLAAIFKIESHNHPSFIEPYQGAATGVGGIMRDVFTMGARPIANLNALRFGSPEDPRTRHLVAGVVAGIGGYGNCMGVPTVGGEVNFHPSYNGNCLVNAMTVGLASSDRIFYSRAAGVGNPVIYVGAKTGRDGIHGATMASAEFSEGTEEKRPTVQVGDPFTEKLLLEACLELMATDAIVSIQDMGAAGLTSSSVEMSSKGGVGIELDLDRVPCRETGMVPYEIMLSESQERMLMVIRPEARDTARAIFEKWELDFAEIGRLTDSGHLVLRWHGAVAADIPVEPLVAEAPVYDRPWVATPPRQPIDPAVARNGDIGVALRKLVGSPDLASRRWVWEQYDHLVMGHTRQRPGGDAAIVRIPGTNRGLALTTDCTPRYCHADPQRGGAQAVVESWRNLTAVGARPLAITDNMNFGNPERPEIMGQFVGCIEGIRAACLALDYPVVSGNVSFYNETNGRGIMPTPVIGGVGLIDDLGRVAAARFDRPGLVLLLVGATEGHLGSSLWLREIAGSEEGPPPAIDPATERRHGDFVRTAIVSHGVRACHDLSDGGLLVAAAEMAIAGDCGAEIAVPKDRAGAAIAWLFGEDQARYLMAVEPAMLDRIRRNAADAGVPVARIGETGGDALTVAGLAAISVGDLRKTHEGWLPSYMSGKS